MAHRRRGVGVGRTGAGMKVATQKKADELKAVSLQSAIDTVEKLEIKLTNFAKVHRDEIQNDPVFRHSFLKMCAPLGVDPLSSKKTVLGNLLGMGDFYYELAVKIAEVCLANRSKNGGLISITEVQQILAKRKTKLGMVSANSTTTKVSVSDIEVAIQKLSTLGGGFRTIKVGKLTMIVSVPTELDNDHMTIMSIAAASQDENNNSSSSNNTGGGGGITIRQIQDHTGWTQQRIERAIELLLQEGMAWLDTYKNVDYYWFTSIWQEQQQQQQTK